MILILWKGVTVAIGLDADRRWTGPPDLVPELDAAFGPDQYATVDDQRIAVAHRLGGVHSPTPVTTEAPADGSA